METEISNTSLGRNETDVTEKWEAMDDWETLCFVLLIPTICSVGFMGNIFSCVVLNKVKFKESLYVYLKGLKYL